MIDLLDGRTMPVLGLGTWQLKGSNLRAVLEKALDVGYRLIDSAAYYDNERDVGSVIAHSEVPRDQIFITTKIRGLDQGRTRTRRGLESSLDRFGLDFVDLALIHWPLPLRGLYVDTWRELVEARDAGLTKSIGVSNFDPCHIDRLVADSGVYPCVNQVQCNPAVPNLAMRRHAWSHGIRVQAWEPLGIRSKVLDSAAVLRVADETGRTPAQVVLRWHVDQRTAVIPRTGRPERVDENFSVWGWTLSDAHRAMLDDLDLCGADRADPSVVVVD